MNWVIDLDGVIWVGDRAIHGSSDAISRLIEAGHAVVFCTNNAGARIGDVERRLQDHGIDGTGRVVSSATALGSLLRPGQRVLCCAGPGAVEAVNAADAVVVDPRDDRDPSWHDIDVVVIGFHRDVDYQTLQAATRAVLGGAHFLATNDDPIYPDTDGPSPGCGAILAAVERATGQSAQVAGKPNAAMVDLVRRVTGGGPGVVVGDSIGTDGRLAERLGWPFGLVLSGNTGEAAVPPDMDRRWVAPDLATLVDRLVSAQ